ncbi:uncharacterized protein LOC129220240 isoform X2 [Uloborus diversus]|uniref:uncharacterized protein LOC129220240 isoform X2 n=1 Tax=Uloborus diversus TaxID=327109 RepID=UPI002409A724|nr:uncharacterized protein LOC129220240 isoform X2 [Uloborus diversus]
MMDCVAYEATLDSSFQKDRLELVNKGSLGRRRKPSRANLKLLLSPSSKIQDPDQFSPLSQKSSSPKNPAKKIIANGDVSWRKAVTQSNQRSLRNGTFRDEKSFQTAQQNGSKCPNGKKNGITKQEPEWISLSRKLCAKFVEGHIESHSTNSCDHQELNGVEECGITTPETNGIRRKEPLQYFNEEKKKKTVEMPSVENSPSNEPPWVPLSRKLCTKFIEEHIEYPASVCNHSEKPTDVLEPNGDVRIIEKIGNPKSSKKKAKKDSEPEWISLSRKLRAKFIESHIDDPDTIALDNQLNASDPEETSSESLSDTSQEINIQKIECQLTNNSRNRGSFGKELQKDFRCIPSIPRPSRGKNEPFFPEKECCWEYQEMEFDQESNSGTFQDVEFFGDETRNGHHASEATKTDTEPQQKKDFQNFEAPDSSFKNRISFADLEKSKSLKKTGYESNDVLFLPRSTEKDNISTNSQEKKIITVQFIAHPESVQRKKEDITKRTEPHNETHSPFFNLTTWEEAHYVSDHEQAATNQNSSLENSFKKDFRSKSLDDLCDSKEEVFVAEDRESDAVEKADSNQFCTSGFKIKLLCKSEEFLNKDLHSIPNAVSNNDNEADDFTSNWTTKHENLPNGDIQSDIDNRGSKLESEIRLDSDEPKTSNIKLDNESKQLNVKKSEVSQTELESFKCDSKPKCNGVIPNTRNHNSKTETLKLNNGLDINASELQRPGMSKWVNFTKAKNASKNEYANIDGQKSTKPNGDVRHKQKHKATENESSSKSYGKIASKKEHENQSTIKESFSIDDKTESISYDQDEINGIEDNNMNYEQEKIKRRHKSKSLCDLSYNSNAFVAKSSDSDAYIDSKRRSIADIPTVVVRDSASPRVEFQDFSEESEIPLCAKLVSKQNRKNISSHKTPSVSSCSVRNESPCSESSHVYEDMFKETSCPSDSEASSWSVMKKNSYYVNGRSSSMNDLDLSDSCSLSIKCDYASSCSGQSTLQSRQSSCGSSSFYVNLRDYDSHMLEPSLIRRRKERSKLQSNGKAIKITKSNPPTPESLRHLFTSPLSSVHTPTNGTSRLLSRLPPDSQSHYYSTASTTSSAFKNGFDLTPPKPKKTERSSSIKIKDIAHGIILTFRRLQNHSKNSHVSPTHYVDVSHLAEHGSKTNVNADFEKLKSKKSQKEFIKNQDLERNQVFENGRTGSDSSHNLPDVNRAKARRSSSDSTGMKSKFDMLNTDKKKSKNGKLKLRDKGKKSRSKTTETRNIPTVSRKVQQMADGTLYLVTTVSGDTALPGVYSDSPDTSSELSTHRPVKISGESNC